MYAEEIREGQRYRVLNILQVGLGVAYQLDSAETGGKDVIVLKSQCDNQREFSVQPDPSGYVFPKSVGNLQHAEAMRLQQRAA